MKNVVRKIKNKYTLEIAVDQKRFEKALETIGYKIKDNCAMAFDKAEAIKKLKSLSLPITEHIMKILVMPKSSYIPHWRTELKTWQNTLRRYNNGKTKSGVNYSMTLLMTHLWEKPLSTSKDQTTLLKILAEAGYTVPNKALTPNQIKKLKTSVETFASEILS